MKNIDRIAQIAAKTKGVGIVIHAIPGTRNWIVCQSININKWEMILCDPMGEKMHPLGFITDDQQVKLTFDLFKLEVEQKTSFIQDQQQVIFKEALSY